MAQRRMFSKEIIDSDEFMDMPLSAQAVYMHLCMHADDDGFVSKSKSILRMICGTQEDFDTLVSKGYIRVFENSVMAIVHWTAHNYIRSDRYKPTIYQDEKEILMQEVAACEAKNEDGRQLVYQMDTQDRLGKVRSDKDSSDKDRSGKDRSDKDSSGKDRSDKDRSDKDRSGKDNIHSQESCGSICEGDCKKDDESESAKGDNLCECEKIISLFNNICTALPRVSSLTRSRKKQIALLLENYTCEQIEEVFAKANSCDFLRGKGAKGWRASFDWLIKEDNFLKVREGSYTDGTQHRSSAPAHSASYDIDEYERFSIFDTG